MSTFTIADVLYSPVYIYCNCKQGVGMGVHVVCGMSVGNFTVVHHRVVLLVRLLEQHTYCATIDSQIDTMQDSFSECVVMLIKFMIIY